MLFIDLFREMRKILPFSNLEKGYKTYYLASGDLSFACNLDTDLA